ncbi:MAG: hypothetical protein RL266_2314 [Bacteroidota bacterium]|jgi:chemotaxis protein methyltransferase CheR
MSNHPKLTVGESEVDRIIEVVRNVRGIDFSGYSRASFTRRVQRIVDRDASGRFSALIDRLSGGGDYMGVFINEVTVNVTEMFRDPEFFLALRERVIPQLRDKETIKVWHAGCSTGEEVYSMCIVLHEAGCLGKTEIIATDLNTEALEKASRGIIPIKSMLDYEQSYINSGGTGKLSDYFQIDYGSATFSPLLRRSVQFRNHNLVSDQCIGQFDLIVCRNVLIYFQKPLQSTVVRLFSESLNKRGFLCLGTKESLLFADDRFAFEEVDPKEKVYRKK